MHNSTTIAKAKAMAETLSLASVNDLSEKTVKENYKQLCEMLDKVAIIAKNYEDLCNTDHRLILSYEDTIGELEREIIRLRNEQANIKWTNINI
jgi:hypothetical protein